MYASVLVVFPKQECDLVKFWWHRCENNELTLDRMKFDKELIGIKNCRTLLISKIANKFTITDNHERKCI